MNKQILSVLLAVVIAGCQSIPERGIFLNSFSTTISSPSKISLVLKTGRVTSGPSSMLLPAGNIYVPINSGHSNPNWAYGKPEQKKFVEALASILKRNNSFADVNIQYLTTNKAADYNVILNFISSDQPGEESIYLIDFEMTILDEKSKQIVYSKREKFQSNTWGEIASYSESISNALLPAKHKAEEKLLNISLRNLEEWQSK